MSTTTKRGARVLFDASSVNILAKTDGSVLAQGSLKRGLYRLNEARHRHANNLALVMDPINLWHQRLGHVSNQGIKCMVDQRVVQGIQLSQASAEEHCTGCILGKSHRSVIPKSRTTRSSEVLELVHTDVLGPVEVPSIGGSRYVITFIDDYSNWTVQYTMKTKSEALCCFKKYKAMAEKHTSNKVKMIHVFESISCTPHTSKQLQIKALRSDNGGEYLSNEFKAFLTQHGIKHELTVAYTPQQNGVAERMNRTLC